MLLTNWIALAGNVEILDGCITFKQSVETQSSAQASTDTQPRFGHVRSDAEFENGSVKFEAFLPDSMSKVTIGLGNTQSAIHAGINNLYSLYGISVYNNQQWQILDGTGMAGNITTPNWFRVRVEVDGAKVILFINDVLVSATSIQVPKGPVSVFMQGDGEIKVRNVEIAVKKPDCFVVMQFTDAFNALFTEVIRPTCEKYGYKVIRADDYHTSGLIIEDIIRSIRESSIVIADITPDNPNVFYELGYAHGIGKPTILLSDKKRDHLPFDLAGYRTIFYDNSIAGKSVVEERLMRHLSALAKQ